MTPLRCLVQGDWLPAYAHAGDAGADLRSAVAVTIPPRGRLLVPTGIRIALPEGHAGLIWPRSGLAVERGLDCGAGVIDSQYRGEIRVLLFNHSDEAVAIQPGDRIAQLVIQPVARVRFEPVEALPDTGRGESGFGSTG